MRHSRQDESRIRKRCSGIRRVSAAVDSPRLVSSRLASPTRRYSLFRPSVRTRDVKAALRRNVYGGDGTYVNTELIVRSWSAFSVAENSAPSAMENDERRGRYQGCNVVQGRSTIDPSRAAEELVHEIVEYDEIVSPRELFDWLGNAKRKLSVFSRRWYRGSEISRSRTRTMYIQGWKYR